MNYDYLNIVEKQTNNITEGEQFNSLKYSHQPNTLDRFFIPFTIDENGVKNLYLQRANIHTWKFAGKFRNALCLKGIDEICPYCTTRWSMWRKVKSKYPTLEGKNIFNKIPMDDIKKYYYYLVAKFELDQSYKIVKDENGLPKYTFVIMKKSEKGFEDFKNKLVNPFSFESLEGSEFALQFGKEEEAMTRAKNVTVTPLNAERGLCSQYQTLADKINEEAKNLDWRDCLVKSFRELELTDDHFNTANNSMKDLEKVFDENL